jgi:hypothetical protein
VQLDDSVLCRIYKKTSHASAMAVPPLSDHEQDEPCGFDETPYATSSRMILQGAAPAGAFPMMQQQWMPRIPSISELLNDYSLAQLFSDDGGGGVQDAARLDHQQQHHATTLLGHPVARHLLVNNGSMPGQLLLANATPASDGGTAGKRKTSEDQNGASALLTSHLAAAAKKPPNGSCIGATPFQLGNGLQGSLSGQLLGHQQLLHPNMGMQ